MAASTSASPFVLPSDYSRASYTIPPPATISSTAAPSRAIYRPIKLSPLIMNFPKRDVSPLHSSRFEQYCTEKYPDRSSSLARPISTRSVSTSPPPSFSNNASSYEVSCSHDTDVSSYEHETSWLADGESKNSSAPSPQDSAHSSPVSASSCQFDADDWFAQFRGDIDISDDLPQQKNLDAIAEVPVYDAAGNSRPFKSLYSVGDVVGDRQLIIFIRHFYCGACQAYVRALTQQINMQTYFTMAIPTSIIVIGCGSPELIRMYKAQTQCPFPIFADPSRAVFKHLGMSLSANIGFKRPEYYKKTNEAAWLAGQLIQMGKTKGLKKFRGGNWMQIGGEFLFEDGQVVWCHRMKNYRNHAEIDVLKRVLEIDR